MTDLCLTTANCPTLSAQIIFAIPTSLAPQIAKYLKPTTMQRSSVRALTVCAASFPSPERRALNPSGHLYQKASVWANVLKDGQETSQKINLTEQEKPLALIKINLSISVSSTANKCKM